MTPRRTLRAATALAAALGLLAATGCGLGSDPLAAGERVDRDGSGTIVVGSANFLDSLLIANIYAEALRAEGFEVEERFNIASREAYVPGLIDGSIDLIPEYSGALLQYVHPETGVTADAEVLAELEVRLPEGLAVLEASEAQSKDVLVVTGDTAREHGLETVSDLVPLAGEMTLGGPPEWKTRHNGIVGLREVYGLEFASFVALDAGGPLSLNAVTNGQVDVVDLFTTDPAIGERDLVMLEDDRGLFLAENILPLIREQAVDEEARATLDAVSARLNTDDIREMMGRIISQRENPTLVARDWLTANDLA
ncbi:MULTISPECIES: ABC transporter substrate-binding protein [unclassified Nocardiopsis]|uniref:ABC transporter substrate-binding protein n=1 Tax=Nocardiopsis TaxID=2013 RepID=UPI00387B47E4